MRKLRLDPEQLTVESFDATAADAERRGTVRGNSVTQATFECYGECDSGAWGYTCNGGGGGDTYPATMNPMEGRCISYAIQCPPTEGPTDCLPTRCCGDG